VRRNQRQRPLKREIHGLGHAGPYPAYTRCRLAEARGKDGLARWTGERRFAGEHLIEHAAETVDVRASIECALGTRLLRAHVAGGAEAQPGLGESLLAAAESAGDAEVGHQGVAVGREQEV